MFYFSRKDRWLMLLTGALLAALGYLLLSPRTGQEMTGETAKDTVRLQKSPISSVPAAASPGTSTPPDARPLLFPFDPNTADSATLVRLGLAPWQARNLLRYRAKGGVFRQPRDLARLYGLTHGQYQSLAPYIHIAERFRPAALLDAPPPRPVPDTLRPAPKLAAAERVSLNEADTSLLRRVPGIGRYYASRIASYRQRLGGFVRVEQLLEISGFPQEALSYFVIPYDGVNRLNLNRLTVRQLSAHPYLSFHQARTICDHRRLHGPLTSLDELARLPGFSEQDLKRLAPYVEF